MKIDIIPLEKVSQAQAVQISQLTVQLGYENNPAEMRQRIENLLESKLDRIFVACFEEKIVGWVHGGYKQSLEGPPFVEILGLVVDVNFRKQQLGKKLVDAVKTWGQAFNAHKLRVRCNVVRLESHEFYKNIGFELSKQQMVFDMKFTSQ